MQASRVSKMNAPDRNTWSHGTAISRRVKDWETREYELQLGLVFVEQMDMLTKSIIKRRISELIFEQQDWNVLDLIANSWFRFASYWQQELKGCR